MRKRVIFFTILLAVSCRSDRDKAIKAEVESLRNCAQMINSGIRPIATTRDQRFQGKVEDSTAVCRGGDMASQFRATPWVDWSNYWGAGDAKSKAPEFVKQANHLGPTGRGIDGALLDLEYQRIELIKFNLFDNNKTYQQYVTGRKGVAGPALKFWAGIAPASGASQLSRRGRRGRTGVPRRTDSRTHAHRHLQRHTESADGIHRHAVRAQCRIRYALSRPGPHRTDAQPPWRPPGAAQARPAGDLAQALHARPIQPRRVQRGLRPAGFLEGRRTATTRRRRSSMCWRPSGSSS